MCPQRRNNMADINSSDQALNELKIKTDALPNDWYVTLVNPQNGEPAENMKIARLIEELTVKMPTATNGSNGLLSKDTFKGMMKLISGNDIPKNANDLTVTSYFLNMIANLSNKNDYINYPDGYGVFITFATSYYIAQLSFNFNNQLKFRIRQDGSNNWLAWKNVTTSSINTLSSEANALTDTIIEEVPVSANTPMTLQEDGQPVPMTQTVERYEYSVPKMAEAILALQKEIAELKGGAGKE